MAEGRGLDADLRIAGTIPSRYRCTVGECAEGIDQEAGVPLVKFSQGVDGFDRIVEGARFSRFGADEGEWGKDSCVHEPL